MLGQGTSELVREQRSVLIGSVLAALAERRHCKCGKLLCGGCGECHQLRCDSYMPSGLFDACTADKAKAYKDPDDV